MAKAEQLHQELERIASGELDAFLANEHAGPVRVVLQRGLKSLEDFALLLSPGAKGVMEEIARSSRALTRRNFGNTMQLFAPLYLSDYCVNQCTYCGFRAGNAHGRRRLAEEEIEKEGAWLAQTGFRNLLLVAGESRKHCSMDYMEQSVRILRRHVPMIGIEIHPLEADEYARLHEAGVEYLTVYQETYDRTIYKEVHPAGPKADFDYRLACPERGARGGMNAVNLGVLLGLAPLGRELLSLAAHGRWLERNFPGCRVGFSLPRLRPAAGMAPPKVTVSDHDYVQALFALRQWIPCAEITLSTRESRTMRDGLIPLIVTKVSAASSTAVGGYATGETEGEQFQISDDRNLEAMCQLLKSKGLDPVMNDWVPLRGGPVVSAGAC